MENRCNTFVPVPDNSDLTEPPKIGVESNNSLKNGLLPLHVALEKDLTDIALSLIASGSDVNLKNRHDETPLFIAAKRNNLNVVRSLLNKSNTDVNLFCSGKTPLIVACEEGSSDTVKEIVNNYRTMFWIDIRYLEDLPIHIAANNGSDRIARILLDKMTSVNSLDKRGRTPLWIALFGKHYDVIKILLDDYRVNPNFRYEGSSPLSHAVREGMDDVIRLLMERNVNVHLRDSEKRNVLHYCAVGGRSDFIQVFIDKGVDWNVADSKGYTPFHYAVSNCHLPAIETFIKNGVNVDAGIATGHCSQTPFQSAVKNYNLEVAKLLLEHGADINARDNRSHFAVSKGGTILHWACRNCYDYRIDKIILFLVENRANVNAEADDGRTPLCLLVKHRSTVQLLKLLIHHGATLDTDRGGTPLYWAFYSKSYDVAKFLIEMGTDVNKPIDNFGDEWDRQSVPLHKAEDSDVVKCLIAKGANINALEKDGSTPLHHVKTLQVAKCLIENGADVNMRNFQGDTPLHHVKTVHVADYLIEKGACVNATNHKGYYPIHTVKNIYIAQLLIENGADIDVKTKDGKTVLHSVAENDAFDVEHADLITYFVERGIDPNATDSKGNTAVKLSSFNYNHPAASALVNNGATLDLFNVKSDSCNLYQLRNLVDLFDMLKTDKPLKRSISVIRTHLPLNYREEDSKSTLLHVAVQHGQREFVSHLLKKDLRVKLSKKININARDARGLTPLHVAAKKNDGVIVASLLNSGAVYNAKTLSGQTPLDLTENVVIKLILKQVETAFESVYYNDVDKLTECLCQEKCIINAVNENGCSLLHIACQRNLETAVSFLLEKGTDLSLVNKDKHSVLHTAVAFSDSSIVFAILNSCLNSCYGFNNKIKLPGRQKFKERFRKLLGAFYRFVNLKSSMGQTALHIASQVGSSDIVKTLSQCGVMFDLRDAYGKVPSDYAADKNTANVLLSVENLFTDAKLGLKDIINNLKNNSNTACVSSLTINKFGNTLIEYLNVNGHQDLAGEIEDLNLLNLPREFRWDRQSSEEHTESDSDDFGFGLFD